MNRILIAGFHIMFVQLAYCGIATAGEINGTVHGLPPNAGPIKDAIVIIRVFAPRARADGTLERLPSGQIARGNELTNTLNPPRSDRTNGSFKCPVPAAPGQKERIVIIVFNRERDVVTQVLSGIVLEEGKPLSIDATVPTGDQMGPRNPYLDEYQTFEPYPTCVRRPRLLCRLLRCW